MAKGDVTFDWASIGQKIGSKLEKKAKNVAKLDAQQLGDKFVDIMDTTIKNAVGLSYAEIERILETPLMFTGASINGVHANQEMGVDFSITLFFDFVGDKKMVSLSPKKYVHDLVALFNNGYPTNNIDDEHPIRGVWHGQPLTLYSWSRDGAHFVGKAIREFSIWAESQGIDVIHIQVNPAYDAGDS